MTNDETTTMIAIRVAEGTQLHFGGSRYGAGAELSVPEDIGRRWIVRGWAEQVEQKAEQPAARKRSRR